MNIKGWCPLELTSLLSLLSKKLSRVFSSNTVPKHQFFSIQPSLWFNSHIRTWLQVLKGWPGGICIPQTLESPSLQLQTAINLPRQAEPSKPAGAPDVFWAPTHVRPFSQTLDLDHPLPASPHHFSPHFAADDAEVRRAQRLYESSHNKWQNWDSHPGLSTPKAPVLGTNTSRRKLLGAKARNNLKTHGKEND